MSEEINTEQVTFEDNQPVLDLIEKKGGVFSYLDEELKFPAATDVTFLTKLSQAHAKTASFEKPVKVANSFTVKHYAGNVRHKTHTHTTPLMRIFFSLPNFCWP